MQRTREFKGYVTKLTYDPATRTFNMVREAHPFIRQFEIQNELPPSANQHCTAKESRSDEG